MSTKVCGERYTIKTKNLTLFYKSNNCGSAAVQTDNSLTVSTIKHNKCFLLQNNMFLICVLLSVIKTLLFELKLIFSSTGEALHHRNNLLGEKYFIDIILLSVFVKLLKGKRGLIFNFKKRFVLKIEPTNISSLRLSMKTLFTRKVLDISADNLML